MISYIDHINSYNKWDQHSLKTLCKQWECETQFKQARNSLDPTSACAVKKTTEGRGLGNSKAKALGRPSSIQVSCTVNRVEHKYSSVFSLCRSEINKGWMATRRVRDLSFAPIVIHMPLLALLLPTCNCRKPWLPSSQVHVSMCERFYKLTRRAHCSTFLHVSPIFHFWDSRQKVTSGPQLIL